jgi:acetyl esterase/lipase
MAPLLSHQPFKAIATICFIISTPPYLAFISLLNFPKRRRPLPQWSLQTLLGTKLLQLLFKFYVKIQMQPTIRFKAGSFKDRLVLVPPGSAELYKGVVNTETIQPAAMPGVWFPRLYNAQEHPTVVIHFQGGAYVLAMDPQDVAVIPSRIYEQKLGAFTFFAQYRVSRTESTRFPAALQDAITYYQYVLSLGIDAKDIIISGDSAGANLALALVRYIEDHRNEGLLPVPRGALLWSPWVDLSEDTPGKYKASPRLNSDFVSTPLIQWGKDSFLPVNASDDTGPYTSPLQFPFRCSTPLFIQAGTAELLHAEIKAFAEKMSNVEGNKVHFWDVMHAPHDIILCGPILGFQKEAEETAERAGEFFGLSL